MISSELQLRELETGDEHALAAAVREFAASDPEWDFAFDYDESEAFADYVARLKREQRGIDVPAGWVPHTYLVAALGDKIVGRVSIRHQLTLSLREHGGHCGFGVVSSERGKGVGTMILRQSLPAARTLGIERLLLTCSDQNIGSIRIIEACRGVLEDTRPRNDGGLTRRYWIDL